MDWAHKIDPLLCIPMHGITERYLSDIKTETAGYVGLLLDAIDDKVCTQFTRVSYNYYVNKCKNTSI